MQTTLESVGEDIEDVGQTVLTEAGEAIDEGQRDAAETVARNIATEQGEEQFDDAGHALDGKLSCEANVTDDVASLEISCTGTTQDGEDAALDGTTDEIPGASVTELEGSFTGTVAGEEVFSTDTLGG